jgi:hypothetical protein
VISQLPLVESYGAIAFDLMQQEEKLKSLSVTFTDLTQ